nr:putative reverse transcriptase domain-containing protein [Tanacetum cinerariifolium]
MEDGEEDDAEVINPYEETDPHNQPPHTSDEETEYAPPMVQVADVDNIPIPPVIHFGNFHVGESSSLRDLLEGNDEVCVPGPMPCDLRSVHRGVKRLSKRVKPLGGLGERRIPNSLRFQEEPSIYSAPVPRADDPYVKVRDAARGTREDKDVDTVAPRDTQPPDSRRSLRAVGLVRWFEKMENTFEISKCAEVRKVKFATATLHDRALTWWNS